MSKTPSENAIRAARQAVIIGDGNVGASFDFKDRVLRAAEAIEREMAPEYTNEKPTTPGWYWWRKKGGKAEKPVELRKNDAGQLVFNFSSYEVFEYEAISGQFAGPIPEPKEQC